MTSLAYPLSVPVDATPQLSIGDVNPVRALLSLVAQDSTALWAALDSVYSDSYVETACDPTC